MTLVETNSFRLMKILLHPSGSFFYLRIERTKFTESSHPAPDIVLRRCPLGERGHHSLSFFNRSDQDKWVGFVLLSTQFSVFVRDHVGRKVACLPSHPLEKLVARKKRRGREAVYEASLPPVVEVLGATLIQKVTDGSRLYPVSATPEGRQDQEPKPTVLCHAVELSPFPLLLPFLFYNRGKAALLYGRVCLYLSLGEVASLLRYHLVVLGLVSVLPSKAGKLSIV
ncbi:hypothetical protein RIF29_45441 [Crotalaria pallida]|uniref:Uncharacterized protein n=1 Tax=Crotalaria pallida TaxID=3830 RepID=A0AAN9HLP5_CROPI